MNRTYSFINDDRAVTEPYTDLPAIGLVVVGVLLFGYLLCSAYSACAAKAAYADMKDDLRTLALSLSADPGIALDGGASVLDAHKLDNISTTSEMIRKYGRPGETVAIQVAAGGFRWSSGSMDRVSAGYMLPVTVRLNDACCIAGTLTVIVAGGGR
ncbi:MAG: hypothetical protein ACM3PB_00140 [Betaproteobacteria bacterium]